MLLLCNIWLEWGSSATCFAHCTHPLTLEISVTQARLPPMYIPSMEDLPTYKGNLGNHCSHWPFFGLSELENKRNQYSLSHIINAIKPLHSQVFMFYLNDFSTLKSLPIILSTCICCWYNSCTISC